jgi:aminoglycoside 6-adenylyltransferase
MRSQQEMFDLILNTARQDARVRAVILNGSRANPDAQGDIFQDFDVVYVVTQLESFKQDPAWIDCFGERMILQLPDDMGDPPPDSQISYGYLMQFADGNRIDLGLFPLEKLAELEQDSLSVTLLDKDGILPAFPPADESSYLPTPPNVKTFADCTNEFWWVCPYVAKGLWRGEITYAKYMLDEVIRKQLMKMLVWYIGMQTHFAVNPGKSGKYFQKYLEPALWDLLLKTYADADPERNWQALFLMGELFRLVALRVAGHFALEYPHGDDQRVSAHLRHVHDLPKDAREIY